MVNALACAVARIEQIWEEYQRTGEFRVELMERLATCDVPRLKKVAEQLQGFLEANDA
jgi:hypothetical protein